MQTSSAPGSVDKETTPPRLWDWRAALLTIAIVEISSTRLVVTEWAPYLYFTQTMAFLGVILGLALGYSNFSRPAVTRIAAGYTFVLVPAQLLSAIEKTDWLWEDILALFERLFFSLGQFITNKPVDDPLFFISIVSLAYWLIGIAAGYWLIRHWDFLNVVLPSGVAILIVQAFDLPRSASVHVWQLGIFIFVSLLLMGRLYFLKNQSFWKKTHFLLTDETMSDLERGTLAVTAVAVFVAWSMPGWISGIKPAAQAWREFSQPIFNRFSNAVSALESPYAVNNAGGEFYGASLFLGEQAATSENIIFVVELEEGGFVPVRNYWKGRSYDLYLDGRWTTTKDVNEPFIPTVDELTIAYPQGRLETEYTFTIRAKKQSLLYAPAETVWVSKSANIQSIPDAEGMKDVTAWVADTSLESGSQYKARALIADPSIEELRSAGAEYPAWVKERYLQVPEEIAPRLKELALEITESQKTAYDQAQAITSYLREEIEYQEKIEDTPPEGFDPVLWVLFDYKKGFCMYYASAETLLLRSIGIPARMAVGFVEGKYDEASRKYNVAYKDSHAWTEVYFPGIGWVEFEPTSNQFPLERPETRTNPDEITSDLESKENLAVNPLPPEPLEDQPEPLTDDKTDGSSAVQAKWYRNFISPALILLALGLGIFMLRRYSIIERLPVYLTSQYERRGNTPPLWLNRWVRWTTLSPIERAFQSINLSLYWLGQPQANHVTSQERAVVLIKRMPEAEDQTLSLLKEYHNTIYTPHSGNPATARNAAVKILLKTWQTLIKETLQIVDSRYNQLK